MVWAGISSQARTKFVFIENDFLVTQKYIMEGLEDHVMSSMTTIGKYDIFMKDNTRPHTTRAVREYVNDVGIRRFDRTPLSPDTNLIEHVWVDLGGRIRKHILASRIAQRMRVVITRMEQH